MAAVPTVTVGGKITATEQNAIVGGVNGIALNGVIPTSVGTGVTLSPGGAITFSAVNTVAVNGVFTGTYDNYRITWSSSTRSANTSLSFRLSSAGTVLSSSVYDYTRGSDSGSGRVVSGSSNATAFPIDIGVAIGQYSNGVMDLFGPALTMISTATVQASVLAASACTSVQCSAACESTAGYDGFNIYPSASGTWSGTIRVYGYNNLA